jgi:hypothetical protein
LPDPPEPPPDPAPLAGSPDDPVPPGPAEAPAEAEGFGLALWLGTAEWDGIVASAGEYETACPAAWPLGRPLITPAAPSLAAVGSAVPHPASAAMPITAMAPIADRPKKHLMDPPYSLPLQISTNHYAGSITAACAPDIPDRTDLQVRPYP